MSHRNQLMPLSNCVLTESAHIASNEDFLNFCSPSYYLVIIAFKLLCFKIYCCHKLLIPLERN